MNGNITGLITSVKNNADANRVIEVLTAEYGMVYVFASGARRLSSRFLPLTNLFTVVSLECTSNGNLLLLKDGKCLGGFKSIETDIDKLSMAADAVKNVRTISANSDAKSKIYALCMTYFELLDRCRDTYQAASATVKFYIYLLHYSGFNVTSYAAEYNGQELIEICRYLSGKKVSEAMTDNTTLDSAREAYDTLAHIYAAQLDMRLGKLFQNDFI